MFGRLKRKVEPVGPFEFEHTIEIARPGDEVYGLVDYSDPRNAKRTLGHRLEQLGACPDRFRLWFDLVPDHRFEMTVTEAVPGKSYAYETEITPSIWQLVSSHEAFTVEPLGESSCRLSLTISAWFQGHLSAEEMGAEVMMMGMAGQNALAKLKVHAEQGPDAVHALEAMQTDIFDDEDLASG